MLIVDRFRPYFPPLLDTSHVAEQITPTDLNIDCMEQATTDQIMDTQIKNTRQQKIQLSLMEELNVLGTISS